MSLSFRHAIFHSTKGTTPAQTHFTYSYIHAERTDATMSAKMCETKYSNTNVEYTFTCVSGLQCIRHLSESRRRQSYEFKWLDFIPMRTTSPNETHKFNELVLDCGQTRRSRARPSLSGSNPKAHRVVPVEKWQTTSTDELKNIEFIQSFLIMSILMCVSIALQARRRPFFLFTAQPKPQSPHCKC